MEKLTNKLDQGKLQRKKKHLILNLTTIVTHANIS